MRSEDTALAGGDDSSFGTPPTDEELFAQARAHMEKYSGAASLSRELWDATVRLVERQYVPEGTAADALNNQGRIVRNSIIEECAKVCDLRFKTWDGDPPDGEEREYQWMADEARYCAAAIRKLKRSAISGPLERKE